MIGGVAQNPDGYPFTKRNGKGIGLFTIQRIAKKYQGIAKVSYSDMEFIVAIILNI